jgi:hypothetical protein
MKFGLGTLYSNPENVITPKDWSNLKIEMLSESWFATIIYVPLSSNLKWRGVFPRV